MHVSGECRGSVETFRIAEDNACYAARESFVPKKIATVQLLRFLIFDIIVLESNIVQIDLNKLGGGILRGKILLYCCQVMRMWMYGKGVAGKTAGLPAERTFLKHA